MTTQEKIKKQVDISKDFPNPIIDYNFEEAVEEEWFEGVNHRFNPMVEKNTAKIIYKLS